MIIIEVDVLVSRLVFDFRKKIVNLVTYSEILTPGQLLRDGIDASIIWQSSMDNRMPPLAPFVHGISIKRMECGNCVFNGMFCSPDVGDVAFTGVDFALDPVAAHNVCVFRTADGAANEHDCCDDDVSPFSFSFASD